MSTPGDITRLTVLPVRPAVEALQIYFFDDRCYIRPYSFNDPFEFKSPLEYGFEWDEMAEVALQRFATILNAD